MNHHFLSWATTIKERSIEITSTHSGEYHSNQIIEPLIVSSSTFNDNFNFTEIKKSEFSYEIKGLSFNELRDLYDNYIVSSNWYCTFIEIFEQKEIKPDYKHETALRYFKDFFIKKALIISRSYNLVIEENVFNEVTEAAISDLFNISLKTLVWDVHDIIDRENINEETPELEFITYINKRFGDRIQTASFFIEYPVLTKILVTRLNFHLENFKTFLSSLTEPRIELAKLFNLNNNFVLQDYQSTKGDSHDNGKSTIVFKLNNKKLVYKYKNLEIANSFQEFQFFIKKIYPAYDFHPIKRYTADNFTIEEFVEYKSCASEKELHEYYRNYGYLLAICFWLNSKDLHMENLISCGKFPVLVDLETIISPDMKNIYEVNTAAQKLRYLESKRLVSSGLLPTKEFFDNHLEVSALEGQDITLKNISLPTNLNKSTVMYNEKDLTIPSASNLPKLYENKIHYKKYINDILDGFLSLNNIFLKNKTALLEKAAQLFSNKNVRIILRDTNQYGEFIEYAYHPTCTTDSLEREKVFENLWNYPILNKHPILHETSSLYWNDIPYFYSNSSNKDLHSDQGTIKDYLQCSIISGLEEHVNSITEETISSELLFTKNAMGILRTEATKLNINFVKNDYLKKAIAIERIIRSHLITGNNHKGISWYSVHQKEDESIFLSPSNTSLYDGKTGLYLFYLYLNHLMPNPEYMYILNCLEYDIFETTGKDYHGSAFYGEEAKLYPALCAYRLNGNKYYKNIIKEYLYEIFKRKKYNTNTEWMHGSGGFLKVLFLIYSELKIDVAFQIIKEIVNQLEKEAYSKKGFAHGDIGAYTSLYFIQKIYPSSRVCSLLNNILPGIEATDMNDLSSSWCSGKYGYILYFYNSTNKDFPLKLKDNFSLCHGISGIIDLLINLYNQSLISTEYYLLRIDHLLDKSAVFNLIATPLSLGLFNGITGLGFEFLRLYDCSIPSVLVFD